MVEIVLIKNKEELEKLENIIKTNISAFYEVGRALMEIRNSELYKKVLGYATFEEYCKTRWDFTDRYARYILNSTKTVENLKQIGTMVPVTERQTRPAA